MYCRLDGVGKRQSPYVLVTGSSAVLHQKGGTDLSLSYTRQGFKGALQERRSHFGLEKRNRHE
jgi:hypothetical protein